MIARISPSITAVAVLAATVAETAAGGRPVECYERYDTPAVYGTVQENVVINPASRRVERVPAIIGTRKRAVLISPERVTYEVVPAVTRTEYRKVKVDGVSYSWEWRIIDGRKVLCKIKHRTHYKTVAETVVVRPEQKRRVVIPAQYAYELEQVVLQPAQKRVIDVPPSYETVTRRVVVSDGSSGWRRVEIKRHCG